MKKSILCCLMALLTLASYARELMLIKYVNPLIGTVFEGNAYPGATVPFGMVQLSPDNGLTMSDKYEGYCSGYSYTKNMVKGFSHTHLSGTGRPDLGDISVLPMTGLEPTVGDIRSDISHEQEHASAGYYSVMLKSFGVLAELTATQRCGFHRYTFPEALKSMIRFDLAYGAGDDSTVVSYFKRLDDKTFVGYRISKSSFTKDQRIYFAAKISKPVTNFTLFLNGSRVNQGDEAEGIDIKACLQFSTKKDEQILLKVGLSTANIEGALEGLKEINGWEFDHQKQEAENLWEDELDKIRITSPDEDFKTTFYTALYHSCLAPIRIDDALGKYRGIDREKVRDGRNIYTIHSLWDTYRAENPLLTITQANRIPDIINSYLEFYRQYGLLPVWDMYFCETNTMKGYHAVPVIADAILKGFKGFDYHEAFVAMKASANQNIRGTDWYRKLGYVPIDKDNGSVTSTVEYAYDDWCIAQVAKRLNIKDDYDLFMKRSSYWENVFDNTLLFVRPKDASGNWVTPFDPFSEFINKEYAFAEGNGWQYTWYVPQDVPGLIRKFGAPQRFAQKLDSLFTLTPPKEMSIWQYDGYIGLLWHGNEPCHHIPYLYNYVGMPWKSAERIRQICAFYTNKPKGLCGNDDCGQTSAWYVFSAMGFYPVNPANGEYVLGAPLSDKTVISMGNGNHFIVKAESLTDKNIYIQSATFNGKPYSKTYINHADMLKGGELVLFMGNLPSATWGTKKDDFPH